MTNKEKAAYAAGNCQSNDIEDYDDLVDFLSEKVHSIVRILIPDEMTRVHVMAHTFAKCFFDEAYTGEPFDDIELAKDMVGEYLAEIIIDNDPMLYSDFCEVCGDEGPDYEHSDDDGPSDDCDHNLCGGDCDSCPYRDDIPRYVYENGLIRRIDVRRGSVD